MSLHVSNPNKLTKEQLKKDLLKHNIILPSSESRKQVYVDLYRQHILEEKRVDLNFSSDEEESAVVKFTVRKLNDLFKNKPGSPRKKQSEHLDMPADIAPDIIQLTDGELLAELGRHGIDAGPITGTTRRVYQRKLQTLLSGQPKLEEPDSEEEEEFSDEEVIINKQPERPEIIPERQEPPISSSVGYLGRKSYRVTSERESGDSGMTQIKHRTTREEVSVTRRSEQKSVPKPATNTAPKRGMSVWVQITIFIIVALLVFLVIRNMDPKLTKPLIGGSK